MDEKTGAWGEDVSQLYARIAPVAVPARAEQLATVLTLLPFAPEEAFVALELAAGEGAWSAALLAAFPNATAIALDGSAEMRARAKRSLAPFGPRATVGGFDIFETDWLDALPAVDCAVSSLCVHHLDAPGKRRLFRDLCKKLTARGALLVADLVAPQRPEAQALFADAWDARAREQSVALTGSQDLFETFAAAHWNHYRHPDPEDRPSPLFDQLLWLREAGFEAVDCFWMQAGHAVFGGYVSADGAPRRTLTFAAALEAAHRALDALGGR